MPPIARVNVAPKVIDWILDRLQYEGVGSDVLATLDAWRDGSKIPTAKQIADISKKAKMPFGYFFLEEPPIEEHPITEFRTIKSAELSAPSRNLIDTINTMTDAQEWMSEYMRDYGYGPLPFVGRFDIGAASDEMADDIRRELGISEDWYMDKKISDAADSFKFIRNRIERIGVLVMTNSGVGQDSRRRLDLKEFRAFALIERYAPLIFINTRDTENGRIFSLFHELTHIWLGVNDLYNADETSMNISKTETLCNAIAAELLVPDRLFEKEWDGHRGEDIKRSEELAKTFKCSAFVIIRKALSNGKISKQTYSDLTGLLASRISTHIPKTDTSSGGNFYNMLRSKWDRRFIAALADSVREGRTLYTEAYRLTNTTRKTFDGLIEGRGAIA